MKITKSYLKQIIKEELNRVITESAEATTEINLKYIAYLAHVQKKPDDEKVKNIQGLEWILDNYSDKSNPATISPITGESTVGKVKEMVNKNYPGYPYAK